MATVNIQMNERTEISTAAHATEFEPSEVNARNGVLTFRLADSNVDALIHALGKCETIGGFQIHVSNIFKTCPNPQCNHECYHKAAVCEECRYDFLTDKMPKKKKKS